MNEIQALRKDLNQALANTGALIFAMTAIIQTLPKESALLAAHHLKALSERSAELGIAAPVHDQLQAAQADTALVLMEQMLARAAQP